MAFQKTDSGLKRLADRLALKIDIKCVVFAGQQPQFVFYAGWLERVRRLNGQLDRYVVIQIAVEQHGRWITQPGQRPPSLRPQKPAAAGRNMGSAGRISLR